MEKDINDFLESRGMEKDDPEPNAPEPKANTPPSESTQWDNVIMKESVYLIMGDRRMGKSALAYWLLEYYSKKYDLLPAVVGLPREKQSLLPQTFVIKDSPEECTTLENAIVFIDEAGLQLPIEDTKSREYMVNFLSLPGHRNQILLLAFHFPKLVLMRYLPFFDAFLMKRPPYLLEFAGKRQNDMLTQLMHRAEERFAEFPTPEEIKKHTYVVAPRLRWQGMITNPLPSFWADDLSKVWAGTKMAPKKPVGKPEPTQPELFEPAQLARAQAKGWMADDPDKKLVYPVTGEMMSRGKQVEEYLFQNSGYAIMEDEVTRVRWVKQVY